MAAFPSEHRLIGSSGRERHVPKSHPVVRRTLPPADDADEWPEGIDTSRFLGDPQPLDPVSASERAGITDRIDAIAAAVQHLPDVPLGVQQRRLLRVIGVELLRRADSEPSWLKSKEDGRGA